MYSKSKTQLVHAAKQIKQEVGFANLTLPPSVDASYIYSIITAILSLVSHYLYYSYCYSFHLLIIMCKHSFFVLAFLPHVVFYIMYFFPFPLRTLVHEKCHYAPVHCIWMNN